MVFNFSIYIQFCTTDTDGCMVLLFTNWHGIMLYIPTVKMESISDRLSYLDPMVDLALSYTIDPKRPRDPTRGYLAWRQM